MKTIILKRKSWHWYLANLGSGCDSSTDICTYTLEVLCGLVLFICLVTLGLGACIAVGNTLGFLAAMLFNFTLIEPRILPATVLATGMTLVLVWIMTKIIGHFACVNEERPPSFIREAYSAWKSKYCIKVEVQ